MPQLAMAFESPTTEIAPPSMKIGSGIEAGRLLRAGLIAAVTWWVYAPASRGGWVWDDSVEIALNPDLRTAGGLLNIWSGGPNNPDFFPLKSTVEWAEWHLWGDQPVGYHLVTLCLHLACAFLLWSLLSRFRVRLAWLGGLLFAIHPLAVESVAWNSELKNTLSLALLLPAMAAFVDWDDGAAGPVCYWRSVALFALALLAKSSIVMFPCCLLFYAWWKRGSVGRRDVAASAPFFLLSLVLGLATLWFQSRRAIGDAAIPVEGGAFRLEGAILAVGFYAWKCLVPVRLMPVYPRWDFGEAITLEALLALAGLSVAWVASWRARAGWGRHALFGSGCFLVNLLPVIGLVPMAFHRIAWVSDHFAYVPLACAVGLAAGALGRLSARWLAAPAAAACMFLAAQSRTEAALYRDDRAFWSFALDRNPQAWIAHENLGKHLYREGRFGEAAAHFRAAVGITPDLPEGWYNLGLARQMEGCSAAEALEYFSRAVSLRARFPEAPFCLGTALLRAGRPSEAIDPLEQALRGRPEYPEAEHSLGIAFAQVGRPDLAIAHFRAELAERPGSFEAEFELGSTLAQQGLLLEAIPHLETAARLRTDSLDARMALASALAQSYRISDAISAYREALKISPSAAEAHNNLGVLLAQEGQFAEARVEFELALRIRPDYADAARNLARVEALR